jgi:hypothetical protein
MGDGTMLFRLITSAGMVAFAYYLGKQVGRMEPIREELARARDAQRVESTTLDQDGNVVADQGPEANESDRKRL